ncbi:MAG: hypothetical protein ACFFG0_00630 [Candidatus Thorarchaeota archaeon]
MTRKELKQKIKEEQKQLAQKIKRCRPLRKPHLYQEASLEMQQQCRSWTASQLSWEYRHRHIIYCNMFNGTPYEKIERITRDDNSPSSRLLEKYKNEWENILDEEIIRDCA